MNEGRIEQVGSPADIYDHPATPFVMQFIGPVNVLPTHAHLVQANGLQSQEVFLRPHDIILETDPSSTGVTARVQRLIHLGREIQVELSLVDGHPLWVHLSREQFHQRPLQPDQRVYVRLKQVRSFPPLSPRVLATAGAH
jgi:sulfate transport system ATP-binding protein